MDECRRRYGPARTPTMRYIEKAAYTWEREGIFSIDAAEDYLKRLSLKKGRAHEIKACLLYTYYKSFRIFLNHIVDIFQCIIHYNPSFK